MVTSYLCAVRSFRQTFSSDTPQLSSDSQQQQEDELIPPPPRPCASQQNDRELRVFLLGPDPRNQILAPQCAQAQFGGSAPLHEFMEEARFEPGGS